MEFDLIELIRRHTAQARDDVRLGIGDDAAVLAVPAGQVILIATLIDVIGGYTIGIRVARRDLSIGADQ